jgi:hypothetical protein
LFTVILAGHVIVGFCASTTVTVNVQDAVLPDASVAVTVTVVVPTGKKLPDAGLELTVTPGQLSLADGKLYVTTAPHWLVVLFTVMFAGQLPIVGFCASTTVTVNVQLDVLPAASVAVAVTVVVPLGKKLPDEGL